MFPTHGVGGAQDLPIPAGLAILGAGIALTVSFVVLAVAWRQPRFDGATAGHPIPGWLAGVVGAPSMRIGARCLGLIILGYVVWVTYWGPDLANNPVFGVAYVLVWVGIVPLSLLFGPVWRALSPARTIHGGICQMARLDPERGALTLPTWVGFWPATTGLFGFVWLELIYERAAYLDTIQIALVTYLAVVVFGAVCFGEEWFERADPFEAYSTLIAHLAPVGRRADGTLAWQTPLAHLDRLNPVPSRVAVVSVLLGSTAFDSFSRSSNWVSFSQALPVNEGVLGTLTLLGFVVFVAVTFAGGAMATTAPPTIARRRLPAYFAHSLVPIIVGYVIAHYLTLLVEFGQEVVIQLSDPMVDGSDLFGTADWQVSYFVSTHPATLATVKVLAVLTGHVVGVIAAHDRAIKILPARHQVRGQLVLLVVMVTYTVGGLFLLFSG